MTSEWRAESAVREEGLVQCSDAYLTTTIDDLEGGLDRHGWNDLVLGFSSSRRVRKNARKNGDSLG